MMYRMFWILFTILQLIDYSKAVGADDSLGQGDTTGFSGWQNIENIVITTHFTPTTGGTLDSIKAFIQTSAAAKNVEYGIYKTSDSSFVDSTLPTSKSIDTSWKKVDFELGATIYADTQYSLCVWGASGGGNHLVAVTALGGVGWVVTNVSPAFADWARPFWGTGSGHTYELCVIAYYTTAAAPTGQIIIISGED